MLSEQSRSTLALYFDTEFCQMSWNVAAAMVLILEMGGNLYPIFSLPC